MRVDQALDIIRRLAVGVDPLTGKRLGHNSVLQHPDVVQALFIATQLLENKVLPRDVPPSIKTRSPANAGNAWTKEEEQQLIEAFDADQSVAHLAESHQRSVGAIRARLLRLGKLEPSTSAVEQALWIDELEQCLKCLDLSGFCPRGRAKGTALITQTIEAFCQQRGVAFFPEVFLGKCREDGGKKGRVDGVIHTQTSRYCIEIDSSNKTWSLEKLLYSASIGYRPIWVRWCGEIKWDIPESIRLIDLTRS